MVAVRRPSPWPPQPELWISGTEDHSAVRSDSAIIPHRRQSRAPSANATAGQAGVSINGLSSANLQGDQNASTSSPGSGGPSIAFGVNANDSGNANVYLCVGAIDSENGQDNITATSWHADQRAAGPP